MFLRSMLLLAATLAAGSALTQTAFAGTIEATPEIYGAGTIDHADPDRDWIAECTQSAPARDSDHVVCPTWTIPGGSAHINSFAIQAIPAPGWTFSSWTGCDRVEGDRCTLTAPPIEITRPWKPVAKFVDRTMPEYLSDLTVKPWDDEGYFVVDWTEREPGLSFRCAIDDGAPFSCKPGMVLKLAEGHHDLYARAVDPSGNAGPLRDEIVAVVDTTLPVGPPEGARVRSSVFGARTVAGDEFECSIDGAPFAACGRAWPNQTTQLELPELADGTHTLRVRATFGDAVDPVPVSRTWTLDTTAPDTTVRETARGLELSADEPGVTFRCRFDGRPFADCASPVALGDLKPGPHTLDAYATDVAGNVERSPVHHGWTLLTPAPTATPTPTPVATPDAPVTVAPAPVTVPAAPPAAAPARPAFTLRHTYRKGRLTQLKTVGLPAGTKVVVTVKCPRKQACPKSPTTLRKLVGKRLAKGTKITVAAGATTRTITLRG